MSYRLARTALGPALIVALAVAVSGCDGGGNVEPAGSTGSAPSSVSASSTAANQTSLLLSANDRLLNLERSITATTTPTGTTKVTREGTDAVQFDITSQYGNATAVVLNGEAWAKADQPYWRVWAKSSDSIDAAALAGRWVLVTGTTTGRSFNPSPEVPFRHPDDTKKVRSDTVSGTPVDVYEDPVSGSTVYLTTGDAPLPVKIELPDSAVITIFVPESATKIAAPAASEVVDGRDLVR